MLNRWNNPTPFLLVFLILFSLPQISASAVIEQSVDNLVRNSSDIVTAQVLNQKAEWNPDKTYIFTKVTLKVNESYKGSIGVTSTITVMVPGGEVGEIGLKVEHAPVFNDGEHVIVFLTPLDNAQYRVTSWELGKFTIEADKIREKDVSVSAFVNEIKEALK